MDFKRMKRSDEERLFHVNWDDQITSNIFYPNRHSELNFGNNSEAKAMDKNVENNQNQRRIQGPIQDPKISSTSNDTVIHME